MDIVGYAIDRERGIFTSDGERCAEPSFFEFLLRKRESSTIRVLSDMDRDAAALFALTLAPDQLKVLANTKRLWCPPYQVIHYPGRFLSIAKGSERGAPAVLFSDMGQYNEELRHVEDGGDAHLLTRAYWARGVGVEVHEALKGVGLDPQTLISPANVYKKTMATMNLPHIEDVPDRDILDAAHECIDGQWFEAMSRGTWEHVFDYDIRACHPATAAGLMDTRYGRWLRSPDYQADAVYGFARCEVMIDKGVRFHPIMFRVGHGDGGRLFTPTGIWERSLTKGMIDWIHKWGVGYATVLDGWWWFPTQEPRYPLERAVRELFAARERAESELERDVIKRLLVGAFFGVFGEHYPGSGKPYGPFYFSPWAAEIDATAKLKIAGACMENGISPLQVAADGFLSEKPMPTPDPEALGAWRLSHEGRATIINSALTCVEGKRGQGDFTVPLEWLEEQVKQFPKDTRYELKAQAVLTLGRAVAENRPGDLGKVETVTQTIDIPYEDKRFYLKKPGCGADLLRGTYESAPWTVKMLKAKFGVKGGDYIDDDGG